MCCDSPSPPAPDPNIGIAAAANAETAKEMAAVAREELAWNKEKYAKQEPLIQQVVNSQLSSMQNNEARSAEQWGRYKSLFAPVEDQMVADALKEGSPEQKETEAEKARAQVASSFEAGRDATQRDMARSLGVNPASMKAAAFNVQSGNEQAASEAGAANNARTSARLRGIAMRSGVAQFGRGMPQTGIAADSLALQGGNAAVGNIGAASTIRNAGVGSAAPWFGGSIQGNSSAGNLYLGQFGAQMQGYQAQQQADSAMFGGLGQLGGMVLSASKSPWWMGVRKGGIIGKYGIKRVGYVDGGIVRGPGDGTVDTVPAVVDGQQPAALANGEGVLNVEATQLVGEDFVHRLNAAALAMKEAIKRLGVQQPQFNGGVA